MCSFYTYSVGLHAWKSLRPSRAELSPAEGTALPAPSSPWACNDERAVTIALHVITVESHCGAVLCPCTYHNTGWASWKQPASCNAVRQGGVPCMLVPSTPPCHLSSCIFYFMKDLKRKRNERSKGEIVLWTMPLEISASYNMYMCVCGKIVVWMSVSYIHVH